MVVVVMVMVLLLLLPVAYELWDEGLVWLIRAVVCLCAAPRVQLFTSAGNGWAA